MLSLRLIIPGINTLVRNWFNWSQICADLLHLECWDLARIMANDGRGLTLQAHEVQSNMLDSMHGVMN